MTEMPSNEVSFAFLNTIIAENHDALTHLIRYIKMVASVLRNPPIPFLPPRGTERMPSPLSVKVHREKRPHDGTLWRPFILCLLARIALNEAMTPAQWVHLPRDQVVGAKAHPAWI